MLTLKSSVLTTGNIAGLVHAQEFHGILERSIESECLPYRKLEEVDTRIRAARLEKKCMEENVHLVRRSQATPVQCSDVLGIYRSCSSSLNLDPSRGPLTLFLRIVPKH